MNNEERVARAAAKRRKAEALASLLRQLRAHRGYSQTETARRAGVPRQLLSGLEGARRPRPEPATLEKLAEALGVRPAQLRGLEPIPELGGTAAQLAPEAPPAIDYVTSLGLLPALPPGTTIIQRRNADGSTEVYLHIPSPCERGDGDNADATGAE